jgi:glutathione S-transferase
MITLYTFGPYFGLPDPSPFVVKAMTLFKLAGVDYVEKRGSPMRAPKRKLPYIDDNGALIGDSTFIRFHLEKAYGADFDKNLTQEQRAQNWTIEKMCDEHLYWIVVGERWLDDENFERGPKAFFQSAPAIIRPFVTKMIRRDVAKSAWRQGLARHTPEERSELGRRDVEALSTLLGDKPYVSGDAPCGADATVFAFVASLLSPTFKTPTGDAALAKPNLVAYRDRMMRAYFPEFA